MTESSPETKIVIIGAGVGGLMTAIFLKRKLNYDNFVIYERAGDVGGTWRDNTYPGCACDVPTGWYSLSTDLNPDWTKEFSGREEILAYWLSLTSKYNLRPKIVFNSNVEELRWDSSSQLYRIKMTKSDAYSKKKSQTKPREFEDSARIVISAVGGFAIPIFADLPGKDIFKGDMWHSGEWNHDISLAGKKVAVIGNGCSASQFIPIISKDMSTDIINFCRTPHWRVPVPQINFSSVSKWIFRYVPYAQRTYRNWIYLRSDALWSAFPLKTRITRSIITRLSKYYIRKTAPEKYHEKLIPKFEFGCKRTILDPGYLHALKQSNVDLNWDGIERFTETGLVTKTGEEFKFDIIIFATGFAVMYNPMNVIGSKGQTINEYWETQGGPTAYLGMTTPGFPNYFTLFGPNTATGHASVIFTEEVQINYILQLIKPIIAGKVKSFDVKHESTRVYNEEIQEKLKGTVFTTCLSWYRAGENNNGKIFSNYPGTMANYWWKSLTPKWEDYESFGVTNWKPLGRVWGLMKSLIIS